MRRIALAGVICTAGIIATVAGVAGGLLSTAVAGVAFSALRAWTGGRLIGPILAHWTADALLVAALYRQKGRAK